MEINKMQMPERNKWNIFLDVSTLRLFINGIIFFFLAGLLLVKVLPPYKGGIPMSTDLHERVFYTLFSAAVLYPATICWLRMQHRTVFKIIILPVLLFVAFFSGAFLNNWVFKPWVMAVPFMSAYIHNWVFSMAWFIPFSVSLAIAVLFYIEQLFFKWVRAGVSA